MKLRLEQLGPDDAYVELDLEGDKVRFGVGYAASAQRALVTLLTEDEVRALRENLDLITTFLPD